MTPRYQPLMDWSKIQASAPGRFILTGEFAELYEKNAIAIAIDCRTRVVIKPHKEGRLRLNLKNYNNIREWPTTSFTMTKLVSKSYEILEYVESMPLKLNHLLHKRYYQSETPPKLKQHQNQNHNQSSRVNNNNPSTSTSTSSTPTNKATVTATVPSADQVIRQADNGAMAFLILYIALGDSYAESAHPSIDVEVESDVPIGRGLGSSSALAVALCAALMKVFRVSSEPYVISSWALNIDKFFHGMASGLNTSVVVHGGYIYFQHNKVKAHGIPHLSPIKVMFIDTGIRTDPRSVNSSVAEQMLQQSHRLNSIFNMISELASTAWRKINDPHFAPRTIAGQLHTNQEQLDALGLGHSRLSDICNRGHEHKLAVKQTQGGETAFILYDELDNCRHIMEFREFLTEMGYPHENHDISCQGIDIFITPAPKIKTENPPRMR